MNRFEYVTPDSIESAASLLAEARDADQSLVKAGGIDVLDRLKEGLDAPKRVINLRVARRRGDPIRPADDHDFIAIDALATLAEVAAHDELRERFPALAAAAAHAATPQIRNVATVGGNLCQKPRCWYYRSAEYHCLKKGGSTCYAVMGDNRYHAIIGAGACHIVHPSNIAPALIAYDARIRVVRKQGDDTKERTITMDEFFRVPPNPRHDENVLAPGELIREVLVPLAQGGKRSAYVELREKQSFDWPMMACAVNLNDRAQPRIVLGAVAPIPWRLKHVEEQLPEGKLTEDHFLEARTIAADGAEPMTHNAYKLPLVGVAVERALRKAVE